MTPPQLGKLCGDSNTVTFNVDTRSNVCRMHPTTVNASLHGAVDRQGWFLIPTETRLVEDLDRATLASPQYVIHEVSDLLIDFSSKHTSQCIPSDPC
jgi:hypothetical protein